MVIREGAGSLAGESAGANMDRIRCHMTKLPVPNKNGRSKGVFDEGRERPFFGTGDLN